MITYTPILQPLSFSAGYEAQVLRLDRIHAQISGNKWFKLKHNITQAQALGHHTIITFGGAFSNHIAATAAACRLAGLNAIGIIRGDESQQLNPTLLDAKEQGMQIYFVSRQAYFEKDSETFRHKLEQRFGPHYLIPEGGNNKEGLQGCMEILQPTWEHDYIFCACGTGTMFGGMLASAIPSQKVVGISVLKGANALVQETTALLQSVDPSRTWSIAGNEELEKSTIAQSCLVNTYSFNGYAKFNQTLLDFKNEFERENTIPLDHVYTTKLFYAVFDLIAKQKLTPGAKLLIVHSGGLQGNLGFEERYPAAKGIFSMS